MLIKHTDLDLETVILQDRVQKHKPISAEAVKMLRSKQLVEGRKNALIVAKSIAQATEQEAEYSKAKGFSKEFCCNLILKALEEHEGLPKFKINQLLFEYLPQHLTEEQKDWKVSRLLTTLRDSGDVFWIRVISGENPNRITGKKRRNFKRSLRRKKNINWPSVRLSGSFALEILRGL